MIKKPVVIITGAAGGIGSALARAYAQQGYALSLVDHQGGELTLLTQQLIAEKNDVLPLEGDLESPVFLQHVITASLDQWGRIDVLVNNAAWRTLETMRTISLESWEKTLRVCLTAPAFLSKYAAEAMERGGKGGVIINVSSVMSQRTSGMSPAYSACKGAIESLTYELAVLYGKANIRVVGIAPGNVHTALNNDYTDDHKQDISKTLIDQMNDHTPLGREGFPSEIADVACWLAGSEASFVNGTFIVADGGFSHNFNSYQLKKLQQPNEF